MPKLVLLAACSCLSTTVFAADANRIIKLEQDVRNLERQVSTLQREVRELRQRERGTVRSGTDRISDAPAATSDAWLSAEKWRKVRAGMDELEVIELLGPPTSMREENGVRVLFYAMEIGASGFLSGSVTLKDREVAQVNPPALK